MLIKYLEGNSIFGMVTIFLQIHYHVHIAHLCTVCAADELEIVDSKQ